MILGPLRLLHWSRADQVLVGLQASESRSWLPCLPHGARHRMPQEVFVDTTAALIDVEK